MDPSTFFYILNHFRFSIFRPFQNFHIIDHIRIFMFRINPELPNYGPFYLKIIHFGPLQIFMPSVPFQDFIFQTIPEFLHSEPFQSGSVAYHSRTQKLQSIPEFLNHGIFHDLHVANHSRSFTFWTIPPFLHSKPFNTLLNFGLFHTFYV